MKAFTAGCLLLVLCSSQILADPAPRPHGKPSLDGLKFPFRVAAPSGILPKKAFPSLHFKEPVFIASEPTSSRQLYVVEKGGLIKVFANSPTTSSTSVFLDVSRKIASGNEMGLLGMAFSPQYAADGYVYIHYDIRRSGKVYSVISRWHRLEVTPPKVDPASEKVLLEVPQPYDNHKGGMLAFGPDGDLYLGLGDGGSGGDPGNRAQNLGELLGKILRIKPTEAGYDIPYDNPFYQQPGKRGEIYAYGFRNPWRFSFDSQTGELWVGDVGQDQWEEIDIVEKGGNYGWRLYEGLKPYDLSEGHGQKVLAPVHVYSHNEGVSVTGGYVYRGSRVPALRGVYLFADFETGMIRGLTKAANGTYPYQDLGHLENISSFGQDSDGEVYALQIYDGEVYTFESREGTGGADLPPTLAKSGLFADIATQRFSPSLLPYEINSPLWSDGAGKTRFFAFDPQDSLTFQKDKPYLMPARSVVVKHFTVPYDLREPTRLRPVETRVLVLEEGGWAGYNYKWRADGSDADLIFNGDDALFPYLDLEGREQKWPWHYPTRTDCLRCHMNRAGFLLGLRTDQLNRQVTYAEGSFAQLDEWRRIGLFKAKLPGDIGAQPRLAAWDDASASLDRKARSYLAVNCSSCHSKVGLTHIALDLAFTGDFAGTAVNKVPQFTDFGVPGARIIRPGKKEESVLWLRLKAEDTRRMPPLATLQHDATAIAAIGQWIDGMTK